MNRVDLGWTHIALPSHDIDASIAFYARYARMSIVHDRTESEHVVQQRVVWLSDRTRPFVLVLAQTSKPVEHPLGPFAHLGVALESREAVDELAALARREHRLVKEPHDHGYPVGYVALIGDPDGHVLEISHGQEVGFTIASPPRRNE